MKDYRLIKSGNINTGKERYYIINSERQGYEITKDDWQNCTDYEQLFNSKKGTQLYNLNPQHEND